LTCFLICAALILAGWRLFRFARRIVIEFCILLLDLVIFLMKSLRSA
jgi:hypothetical protein